MALLFMDGFDLYGAAADALLGRWSTEAGSSSNSLVSGRSTGQALRLAGGVNGSLGKGLGVNYGTLTAGAAFRVVSLSTAVVPFQFQDPLATTAQLSVVINTDGSIGVRRGGASGTILGTSAAGAVAANTWTYIEAKILFSTSVGTYDVHVNGASVVSGSSANTSNSTNAYANAIVVSANSTSSNFDIDDFYICDTSGSLNTTFLGDVRIETLYPSADTVTKGFGTAVTYAGNVSGTSTKTSAANELCLTQIIPAVSGTVTGVIANISISASATGKMKGVLYDDTAGAPSTRLGVTTELVGQVTGDNTLTFGSPPSVTAGTTYWVGVISDYAPTYAATASAGTNVSKTSQSESSGPTDPAPGSMSTVTNQYRFAAVIAASSNWGSVKETTEDADYSYIQSSTSTNEDLYSHAALSNNPTSVAAVQVTSMMRKSDAGPRTVTNMCKNGSTDTAGATLYPGGSYQYFADIFQTDPNTSAAWTGTGVNSATFGVKIAS